MTLIIKLRLDVTKFHNAIPGNGAKNLLWFSASVQFIAVATTGIVLRDGCEIRLKILI